MTIVLQNQYWDLDVKKTTFQLHFHLIKKESLEIPFNSITKFYDPFVKFSIQLELNSEKRTLKINKKRIKKLKMKKRKF